MASANVETPDENETCDTFQAVMRHVMSFTDPPASLLLIRHEPVRSSADACAQRQVPMHSGAKAMLIFQKNINKFTLVILPSHLSCDIKKIAIVLGCSHSKLRMANESEVKQITGCIPGAVPPFGFLFPTPLETLIDEKMAQSTSHPPPVATNPNVQLFKTSDPEWPTDLASSRLPELNDDRTDCIHFNVGLRIVSCALPFGEYLRILGQSNYRICDISK